MRAPSSIVLSPLFAALALSSAACGDDTADGAPDLLPRTAIITIDNQSHFPLLELRVHAELEYQDSDNLLGSPLAHGSTINLSITNRNYVTVIRRRIDAGERVAFTTAWPLEMERDGYRLIVFQESFRLVEPVGPLFDGAPEDGGPIDDGAPPGDTPAGDSRGGDA